MNDYLEKFINALFLFQGNKLKGYRTIILNIVILIMSIWDLISSGGILDVLCSSFHIGCNFQQIKIYPFLAMVGAFINIILRRITTTPMGTISNTTVVNSTQ